MSLPTSKSPSSRFSLSRIFAAARQEATGAKTSAYALTTIITGLIFVLITWSLLSFITPNTHPFSLFLLTFLYALVFSPIRYAMEESLRQLFPGTDYNSHQLIKYLNTISYSSLTLNELSRLFFEAFATRFNVAEAAFVFFPTKTTPIIKTSDHFQNLNALDQTELALLTSRLVPEPIPITHLGDHAAQKILNLHHIQVICPLTNNDSLVGLLVLGNKYTLKPYTTKDLKVLAAIAPKIGFAIKNAFEYERIQKKNEELIQDLKDSNQKIRATNRQLKHDDKLKDEFVFLTTHELKNPITAMRGYLALIDEGHFGKVPEKLLSPLKQINQSNQQLIDLLNNLLQIARAEAQKLDINTDSVAICDIISQVIHDLSPLAEQKKLAIKHSCANKAVCVMADRERLREITSNLLSNAIKYSDTGTITISHEIVQDQLHTHVADQGVGIPKSDQAKIFTRFFRVEEEAAKGIPGTGLGLFLVKQLLEKMRGRIWFDSATGVGSTFSFSLPLAHTYRLQSQTK